MRRFSATVRLGKTDRPSGMVQMPRRASCSERRFADLLAVQADAARGRRQSAAHDLQQGRLPGAVGTEQGQAGTGGELRGTRRGRPRCVRRRHGRRPAPAWAWSPDRAGAAAGTGTVAPVPSATSRTGRRQACRVARLGLDVLGAEISGLDGRVGLDRGRVPGGDDLAVVEHGHLVADAHDQAHVVLHQEHGHTFGGQAQQDLPEGGGLLLVEPGLGSSRSRTDGRGGHGPGQLHQTGQAGGQRVGGLVGRCRAARPGPAAVR